MDNGNGKGGLSINDRLPSNNISFQSAVICTVPEIHQALSSSTASSTKQVVTSNTSLSSSIGDDHDDCDNDWEKCDNYVPLLHDRIDVRVTGLVLHTDVKNEFIILGDAVHKPVTVHHNKTKPISTNNKVATTAASTAAESSKLSNNDKSTPSLLGKKRKLIPMKKTNHTSLLDKMKSNDKKLVYRPNIMNKQERLQQHPTVLQDESTVPHVHDSNQTVNPTTQKARVNLDPQITKIIQKKQIQQGMKIIIVDFKHGMNDIIWKDGDLVMVIGKLLFQNNLVNMTSNGNNDDDGVFHRQNYLQSIMDLLFGSSGRNQSSSNHVSIPNDVSDDEIGLNRNLVGGFIEARIITNANGTDVNLLQEGLKLRRQYLHRISLELK